MSNKLTNVLLILLCVLLINQPAKAVDTNSSLISKAIVLGAAIIAGGSINSAFNANASGVTIADSAGSCLNELSKNGWLKGIWEW